MAQQLTRMHPGQPIAAMLAQPMVEDRSIGGSRACACLRRVCGFVRNGRVTEQQRMPDLSSFASGSVMSDPRSFTSSRPDTPTFGPDGTPMVRGPTPPPSGSLGADGSAGGQTAFLPGAFVEVWSNSQQKWFRDGVVEQVVHEDCIIDAYRVSAGSVKAVFGGKKNFKWLNAKDAGKVLRRSPYRWIAVEGPDTLPDRAVLVPGLRGNDACVARNGNEPARLALADVPGSRRVDGHGDILVLGPGFASRWVPTKRGDLLPEDTVLIEGASAESDMCIARDTNGEICALTPSSAAGPKTVQAIWLPGYKQAVEGEVLIVSEERSFS